MASSPFHSGEIAVQERMGVRESIEPWARKVVRSWMPEQHRDFYTQLPFVIAAARDELDRPWLTLLTGEPGFVQSPDASSLVLNTSLLPGDALEGSFGAGSELGLLGIELASRRRNRVNGTIVEAGRGYLRFKVGQAFGNCPQYITEREWYHVDAPAQSASSSRHTALTEPMQRLIASADTFFVGSGKADDGSNSESSGMDASHRGGPSGFVTVESATRLVFPDFAGNNHFNTIGNLVVDPRVALLFVDFETGGLLQITGRASIDWDSPAVARHAGAQRLVVIDVEEIVELTAAMPLRFTDPGELVRELRLLERKRESDDVVSFYFGSRDGGALPDFVAGQHLPLEFATSGLDTPVSRTYSLSNAPGEGVYRISVKREPLGLVSRFLHDELAPGAVINSRPPAGDFVLDDDSRPVVLISAGVGVTPMVSMLHALTNQPSDRQVVWIHSARNGRHHALRNEVQTIATENDTVKTTIAYSQPDSTDVAGQDFDVAGRINADVLRDAVQDLDAAFYLCGPASFLNTVADALADIGVDGSRVHTETF
ncbi:MAG: pyridoxamine 5'-phosphate oxidase family protein [Pseudomonadota bacterium]